MLLNKGTERSNNYIKANTYGCLSVDAEQVYIWEAHQEGSRARVSRWAGAGAGWVCARGDQRRAADGRAGEQVWQVRARMTGTGMDAGRVRWLAGKNIHTLIVGDGEGRTEHGGQGRGGGGRKTTTKGRAVDQISPTESHRSDPLPVISLCTSRHHSWPHWLHGIDSGR
ncbi:hypothetical protein FIBSPDRAFT_885947 [Athelia psychrophila]|uniref:Uncharacterized protein n=1 Tax=Athelia psychrophila TaxID=1759441 RepID=A0A166R9W8_9AGAM|nr:hypothetical protein FIBSPDRAFT_885947 [Fibularhizoctonia sp. CBS 109695]